MPSLFARLLLFISSYSPLFAIFGFLYLRKCPWAALVAFLVAALGLLGLLGFLAHARTQKAPETLMVKCFTARDEQSMSYIVSYIIPFLSISTSTWEQQVALLCFFLMIGVLYVNSNMLHINPTMNLLGFHLYEITTDKGSTHSLIARRRFCGAETIEAASVGEHLYVEAKR